MNFALTEEQILLWESARRFAQNELTGPAEKVEKSRVPPDKSLLERLAEMGFLAVNTEAQYGSLGLGNISELGYSVEEISTLRAERVI